MSAELKVCSEYFVTVGDRFETRRKISTAVSALGEGYLALSEEDEGNIVHIAAAHEILNESYLGVNARDYMTDNTIRIWPINTWAKVQVDFDMLEATGGWGLPSNLTTVLSDLL